MKNLFLSFLILQICLQMGFSQSLMGKRICLDPGHGGTALTDSYRVGVHGEREEWINLRVANYLQDLLRKEGAVVQMTRDSDVFVELVDRAKLAKEFKADLFVSIHHNATADKQVNYPIIYFHGSAIENKASVDFAKELVRQLWQNLQYEGKKEYSIVSDYVIFPDHGASVLRNTYGIPAVIGEASFFSNGVEELRLKDENYNRKEAEAYLRAIEAFFRKGYDQIQPKQAEVMQFAVKQEAARMDPEALAWQNNLEKAKGLLSRKNGADDQEAERLLLLVLQTFPDNYRIHEVYWELIKTYKRLGDKGQMQAFKKRYRHFIVKI